MQRICFTSWLLTLLLCTSVTAGGNLGACCLSNGVCIQLTGLECIKFGGQFHSGSACDDVNCGGAETGACCFSDGSCSILAINVCLAAGGDHQGGGTNCASVSCRICPGTGLCYTVHDSPGCNSAACCAVVCDIDPFCCAFGGSWDDTCVGEALVLCGNCGGDDAGSCFSSNGTPGCNDADCCAMVCAVDPFCCNTFWDGACASEAMDMCVSCGAPGSGSCFEVHDAPFCNNLECCDMVCATDPFCCQSNWDSLCVDEALSLCGHCGDIDAGNCFTANGTVGCANDECCDAVCAMDSFCCTVAWDNLCASEASDLCTGCAEDCEAGGDGTVDAFDLLTILDQWGGPGVCDTNNDGVIDILDILAVLDAWGPCN